MRSITDEEQKVIKKLIEWQSNGQSIKLGEVLLKLYPIEYIKPSDKEGDFYRHALEISYDYNNISSSKILEAINIIDLLIMKDYLIAKEFYADNIIGEKKTDCGLPKMNHISNKTRYVETTLMNYYSYDLWNMLNSYYYVTNSLIDFAKDFKTVEQRRFEEQLNEAKESLITSQKGLKISLCSFIVAILTLLGTIGFGIWQKCTQQEIDSEQINTIISAIKEQKSISIDKFPDIIPDTLNIRVIDASDKQPINLNVTVKENQPTKLQ